MKPYPRIMILIPWFGAWPAWAGLFLESCRWNPSVNFTLVTDAGERGDVPPNVDILQIAFPDYRRMISERLGLQLAWAEPYKLCDIKPALGHIHEDLINGYDFWGFSDIDLIWGDIRGFFGSEIANYKVVSMHKHILSGHFLLLKNSAEMRLAYRKILHWRYLLSSAKHKSFDERIFSLLFLDKQRRKAAGLHRFLVPHMEGALLTEQYSTHIPGLTWIDGTTNFPTEWHWREGKLTSNSSGERQFLYAHFTHWNSRRWAGEQGTWADVEPLVKIEERRPKSFAISRNGFTPLRQAELAAVAHD